VENLNQDDINRLAIEQGLMAARDASDEGQTPVDRARRTEAAEISGRMSVAEAEETEVVFEDWSRDDTEDFYMAQRGLN
jgi:hypothetical protein